MTDDGSIWESSRPCARVRARARVGRDVAVYLSPVTWVWKSASAVSLAPIPRVTDVWRYLSPDSTRHPRAASARTTVDAVRRKRAGCQAGATSAAAQEVWHD